MKRIFLAIVSAATLYSAELIHISNSINEDDLIILRDKYKTNIVISDNRAYIIPQECLLARHFGGLSENQLKTNDSDKYTAPLAVTQAVFEAKNLDEIKEEIHKQNAIDKVEGKIAKEFLENSDGHLFGGLSQKSLDLRKQKKIIETATQYKHPTCKLLDDGLGYKLYDTKNVSLYTKDGFKPIINTSIQFN